MAVVHLLQDDMIQVLRSGGGLAVSATQFHVPDLVALAKSAGGNGPGLWIEDSKSLSAEEMIQIARQGGGKVRFS